MKIHYAFIIALFFFLSVGNFAQADERSTAVYDCCTITTLNVGTDTTTTVALPLSDKECQKRNSSIAHVTAFYTEGTVSDDQRSCIRKSSGASGEWEEIKPSEPIKTPILSVKIPDLKLTDSTCDSTSCSSPWLSEYIQGIYKYGIAAVSILAALALMIAGIIWLTAAGNTERIGTAKKWIQAALAGLLIIYSPYLLLSLINGSLLKLTPIKIAYIQNESLDTNAPIEGSLPSNTEGDLPLATIDTAKNKSDLIAQTYDRMQSLPFSLISSASAADLVCTPVIKKRPDGINFMKQNGVPAIYCPKKGGPDAIRRIIDSIAEKNMITYRYGGKGGGPVYFDGDKEKGGSGDHRCDQDEACTAQLKGHEDEPNNCNFCCPKGQACLDCSGFVNHVLTCAGMPILDTGTGMMTTCAKQSKDKDKISLVTSYDTKNNTVNGVPLVPGDLLIPFGHVTMYIGDGMTAESTPYVPGQPTDYGRRPGQSLVIQPFNTRTYLAIIRSSQLTTRKAGESCDRNSDCAGSLVCENGWLDGRNLGTCKQCIASSQWNCSKKSDCCENDFCRKQSNEHWKCEKLAGNCIPDYGWDCETHSDCCTPGARCKKYQMDDKTYRTKCERPQ